MGERISSKLIAPVPTGIHLAWFTSSFSNIACDSSLLRAASNLALALIPTRRLPISLLILLLMMALSSSLCRPWCASIASRRLWWSCGYPQWWQWECSCR